MTPLTIEIAFALTRALLLWFGSRFFVEHHILTPDQHDRMVEAVAKYVVNSLPLIGLAAWSVRGKLKAHLKYLAARLLPAHAPEHEVKAKAEELEKTVPIRQLAFVDPAMLPQERPR